AQRNRAGGGKVQRVFEGGRTRGGRGTESSPQRDRRQGPRALFPLREKPGAFGIADRGAGRPAAWSYTRARGRTQSLRDPSGAGSSDSPHLPESSARRSARRRDQSTGSFQEARGSNRQRRPCAVPAGARRNVVAQGRTHGARTGRHQRRVGEFLGVSHVRAAAGERHGGLMSVVKMPDVAHPSRPYPSPERRGEIPGATR